jgi:enamine deaminase RidA (YjgF/YER057c/UK114 family)
MSRTYLTRQAPHPWPFSHGVVVSGPVRWIVLAGQVAFDRHGPDRVLVGKGDIAAQTRQALENIRTLLGQAGATLEDIVHLTVYLTDPADMAPAGEVARTYFPDVLPAQTLVVVKALAFEDLRIEIQAVAAVPERPLAPARAPAAKAAAPRARAPVSRGRVRARRR